VALWFIGTVIGVLLLFVSVFYYLLVENRDLQIKADLIYIAQDAYDDLKEKDPLDELFDDVVQKDAALIKGDVIIHMTDDFDDRNLQKYIYKNNDLFITESSSNLLDAIFVLNFTAPFQGAIVVQKKGIVNKVEVVEDLLKILVPILLVSIILIGMRLIAKILDPIQKITNITKQISIENFPHSIDINQQEDEIKELVETFNVMTQRLKSGVETLEQFNSDISHELRTPMTVIKTQLELALRKEHTTKYYKESLQNISFEADKIIVLLENMLLLSRYTKENIAKTFTPCDINSLLINVVDKFSNFAKEKNISIEIVHFDKVHLQANPTLLEVLFSNLLDNAIKYSKEHKQIFISLTAKDFGSIFMIEDEGVGIAPELIDKVTQRFYRVDSSRNKNVDGFGLGLSLVKKIVELHLGELIIESKEMQGTTVKVILQDKNIYPHM
jgi:signal transduction histidine kinase